MSISITSIKSTSIIDIKSGLIIIQLKNTTMSKLIDMQYTLTFGRYKGCTIQAMLDERDHECVNYLLWLQHKLKFEYTEEVQKELRWQDLYVPKHSYNKYTYWEYTLKP